MRGSRGDSVFSRLSKKQLALLGVYIYIFNGLAESFSHVSYQYRNPPITFWFVQPVDLVPIREVGPFQARSFAINSLACVK